MPVRQMSGKVVVLEATPTTTIQEFKQLEGWHPSEDELTRKMSTVDLIVGGEKLLANNQRLGSGRLILLILCWFVIGWFGFPFSWNSSWSSIAFEDNTG